MITTGRVLLCISLVAYFTAIDDVPVQIKEVAIKTTYAIALFGIRLLVAFVSSTSFVTLLIEFFLGKMGVNILTNIAKFLRLF